MAILMFLSSSYALEDTIVLNTAIIPPYQVWSKSQVLEGSSVKVVKCIFDKLKIPLEIKVYSWKKAQQLVQEGEADGFFIASENSIRNKYAKISKELIAGSWQWYTLPKNVAKLSKANFKKRGRVATLTGTNMNSWLSKNYKNVLSAKEAMRLVKLLKIGRIDAFLSTKSIFESAVDKLSLDRNMFKNTLLKSISLGVYFNHKFLKENENFLRKFNNLASGCQ